MSQYYRPAISTTKMYIPGAIAWRAWLQSGCLSQLFIACKISGRISQPALTCNLAVDKLLRREVVVEAIRWYLVGGVFADGNFFELAKGTAGQGAEC